jgi:hypothetical protein
VVLNPGTGALTHADGSEHAWLLLDSVRAMRQACMGKGVVVGGGGRAALAVHLVSFNAAFPGLATPAARIAEEGDGCTVA